jgi:hypothetical protein
MDEQDTGTPFEELDEALEQIRRDVMAFVAQHFEPWDDTRPDDEYEGSMGDDEHVWRLALESVLGPDDFWGRWERAIAEKVPAELTGAEQDLILRVHEACAAVWITAIKAATKLVHEERLFGDAAEHPRVNSPEWTAMLFCLDPDYENSRPVDRVANYITNVRDGLMDATYAFHPVEDEDDEEG